MTQDVTSSWNALLLVVQISHSVLQSNLHLNIYYKVLVYFIICACNHHCVPHGDHQVYMGCIRVWWGVMRGCTGWNSMRRGMIIFLNDPKKNRLPPVWMVCTCARACVIDHVVGLWGRVTVHKKREILFGCTQKKSIVAVKSCR